MSIVIILGAATLLAAPLEAATGRRTARKHRRRVRPCRKSNPPHRRKKSPHTFHSREL